MAFIPIAESPVVPRSVQFGVLPAAEVAVVIHFGSRDTLDQTYGALGRHVAEREIGVDGPVRESYPATIGDAAGSAHHCIEVCWPIFQTTPR
jgi:effector-binding domain-containing protein